MRRIFGRKNVVHVIRCTRVEGEGKEKKKDCTGAEDNLSEPTTRRNAIDYDLWRGVAGRTISVCLVIRKI